MVLFGNMGVGKTSLVERYINNKFEENYLSTLGYNVYEKQFFFEEGITISLLIYDIGGQEKFRDLRKRYAHGANTAFIVFDITNEESFNATLQWKENLFEFAGEIPFILIGNKSDLGTRRRVSKEQVTQIAYDVGAIDFIETSAKTGEKVEEAFRQLTIYTYKSYVSGAYKSKNDT